ncbi:MAG: PIN domain-containing protein [Methylococcaceae bacterium]|nr:PIN domain-containing protein [Methylococcaceae bacterium]
MKGFLLDTNVISELVKPEPNEDVIKFLSAVDNTWLSIISLHELTYGLQLLPQGERRYVLDKKLQQLLLEYSDLVIPIDQSEAYQAALFRVQAKQKGRIIHLADSLIAGTAKAHDLTVVTRNVGDFLGIDVEIFNPWGNK